MPGSNIKSLIQKDILEEIKNRANEYFTDEETGNYYDDIADIYNEIQEYIDSEIKSCVKVMGTDFKNFHIPKDEFIKGYRDIDDYFFVDNKMWGWIYEEVKKTMDDFQKYNEHKDDSIDNEVFIKLKKNILDKSIDSGYYGSLYESLVRSIDEYKEVIEIREKISPYKSLLIELEEIVGSECYNQNIQNYSSWGEFSGEGRGFRYPVTLVTNHEARKLKEIPMSTPGEELIAGHYSFGANELNIYRALFKVVKLLEEKYGFILER